MLMKTHSRRELLRISALGAGAILPPIGHLGLSLTSRVSSPTVTPFQVPLPFPKDLEKKGLTTVTKPDGTMVQADLYELTLQAGEVQILPGLPPTRIWGYNGLHPGPTIRAQSGRPVVVLQHNAVRDDRTCCLKFSTHLHGGNTDGYGDGHPENLIPEGGSKTYIYYNDQPAVTMWYHDHAIHHTARNVYMGLAGFYLVGDQHEASLGLPSGLDDFGTPLDIPMVLQAKFFNADASLNFPPGDHPETAPGEGILGDTILVNGAPWPFLEVQRRRYRFRVLDGSNARQFRLGLSSGQDFILVGTDGGLRTKPLRLKTIDINQAERYEFIIDFAETPTGVDTVVLQNGFAEEPPLGRIMLFKVRPGTVADKSANPDSIGQLMSPALLEKLNTLRAAEPDVPASQRLRFEFTRSGGAGFRINGKAFDPDRDDLSPREGATQILTFVNNSGGWFHPVHLHLLHAGFGFLLLDRKGTAVTETDQEWGWKETVQVKRNNGELRVIMTWPKVPVNPNNQANADRELGPNPARGFRFFERRYVFHCHNIDHEDFDMMAQLRVDR